jgi:nicotinamidase-related amidase
MANDLLPVPLTEKTVHLCIDMQRIFSNDGVWPTPWMNRVLPMVAEIACRFPERTIFTRFITPEKFDDMPGTWRRYYERWRAATRERIEAELLELMPPLARLVPPATIINKTGIPALSNPLWLPICANGKPTASSSPGRRPTFACLLPFSAL